MAETIVDRLCRWLTGVAPADLEAARLRAEAAEARADRALRDADEGWRRYSATQRKVTELRAELAKAAQRPATAPRTPEGARMDVMRSEGGPNGPWKLYEPRKTPPRPTPTPTPAGLAPPRTPTALRPSAGDRRLCDPPELDETGKAFAKVGQRLAELRQDVQRIDAELARRKADDTPPADRRQDVADDPICPDCRYRELGRNLGGTVYVARVALCPLHVREAVRNDPNPRKD